MPKKPTKAEILAAAKKGTKYSDSSEQTYNELLKEMQGKLWQAVETEILHQLSIKDGMIETTSANLKLLARFRKIASGYQSKEKRDLAKWLYGTMLKQIDIAKEYLADLLIDISDKVTNQAKASLATRLGFDGKTFAEQGFLFDLVESTTEIQKIRAATVKGIASGADWGNFYESIKGFVIGNPQRQGVVEYQLKQITYDIFQQNDRAINTEMAETLGLEHYLYAGSSIDTSRPFCIGKSNHTFTKEQVQAWANQSFQGKPIGYNPFIDCGGYNCRHVLKPISKELFERWGKV